LDKIRWIGDDSQSEELSLVAACVVVPDNKHTVISLTYVYGVGRQTALKICKATGIKPSAKMGKLSETEVEKLRTEVGNFTVEGDLRRDINMNIKRLMG
jgi:small subunit ribosomal protein S13